VADGFAGQSRERLSQKNFVNLAGSCARLRTIELGNGRQVSAKHCRVHVHATDSTGERAHVLHVSGPRTYRYKSTRTRARADEPANAGRNGSTGDCDAQQGGASVE
jgi:hypothetical protein